MKVNKILVTGLCLTLFSPFGAMAQQTQTPSSVDDRNEVTRSVSLPDQIGFAVELKGREGVAFMSASGRFILRGTIFDVWNGTVLNTLDDIENSKQTLQLSSLNLQDEDVDPLRIGSGLKEVSLFVDPYCPYCGQVFDQILADPTILEEYTFVTYLLPYLGEQSVRAVNVLSCAEDREAAISALLRKDHRFVFQHADEVEGCDVQPIINRTMMAQMVGVTAVPYIIGAEGGISRGAPNDLRRFLALN